MRLVAWVLGLTFVLCARAAFAADADGSELLPSAPASGGGASGGLIVPSDGTIYPLSAIPMLDSYNPNNPSTPKLYLDFVGDTTNSWGSYDPGMTPAYDADGDPATFSATELNNIYEIWARVAEKYSPFNIDVTTVPPTNTSLKHELTLVIGGNGSWYGLAGGTSYVGAFVSGPNKSFVFTDNLSQSNHGFPRYVAEATAHEAGHEFGLVHQSTWSNGTLVDPYSYGTYNYVAGQVPHPEQPGSKSPIMGDSYYADRGLWWDSTSQNGPNAIQDDMSIISDSTNGFGYRPEPSNTSMATAAPFSMVNGLLTASGVIDHPTDQNFYSFTSSGGLVSFLVGAAPFGPMLDASAEILDSNGNLLAQQDTSSLSEFIDTTLPPTQNPATYDLVVYSHGDYGDVGQYTVQGELGGMVPEPAPMALLLSSLACILFGRNRSMCDR